MKELFVLTIIVFLIGCGGTSSSEVKNNSSDEILNWYKPNINTTWQWQLTGDLNLAYNVNLYDIDLFDTNKTTIQNLHNDGKKVICYFSAGSYENWRDDASDFPSSVLGEDLDGWAGEKWLDIRDIKSLSPIMTNRLDIASQKGCDGVEPDNIDGYTNNSGFDLTANDQLIYNKFIANEAHKRGLSIGLKNDLNQIDSLVSYFDFAVNEQCNYYDECDKLKPFISNNKPVFNAEYDDKYIVNNDANITLCKTTNLLQFQTLVLPKDLNDSFRYSCNPKNKLYNRFDVGFGSSNAFKFQDDDNQSIWVSSVDLMLDENISDNNTYQNIKDFNDTAFTNLQSYLSNAQYFTMWVTKGWEESWYDIDKINYAIQNGKTPVFVYWYFGDDLVEDMPTQGEISDYQDDNIKFKTFLDKIDGIKFVILEPEFNKQTVLDNSDDFITIMSDAIDTIKDDNISLSLCMTDTGNRGVNQTYDKCGYENCALGDKYEWELSKPIYDALLPKLDFISFQEMIGQFSRDPANPGTWDDPNPISYTNDELGIDYLPQRIDNMSKYLYELYKKPIFLPYITIATATWHDSNDDNIIDTDELNLSGYEDTVSNFYKDINRTTLFSSHLFGYSIMELFDIPDHDKGGYQFFMNNEYHLGAIKSSAVDDNDSAINGDIEFKSNIIENIFIPR